MRFFEFYFNKKLLNYIILLGIRLCITWFDPLLLLLKKI